MRSFCHEMVESLQTYITIRILKSVMDWVLQYCTYDHFPLSVMSITRSAFLV